MLDQYDTAEQQDTYLNQWLNIFNTAVVPLYWEGTEPEPGKLRYSADAGNDVYRRPPVDRAVEFCRTNHVKMKGHPLFWQEFIARWLPENRETLFPLIEKRFKEISERYADVIPVFDCVNEPSRLFDQQFEYRNKDWKYIFPPVDYIEQIFTLAEKYFPNNKLILNEATGASFGEFRRVYGGYYLLLEKLINKGIGIDCIGLQCHCSDNNYYKIYSIPKDYTVCLTDTESWENHWWFPKYQYQLRTRKRRRLLWNGFITCASRTKMSTEFSGGILMTTEFYVINSGMPQEKIFHTEALYETVVKSLPTVCLTGW